MRRLSIISTVILLGFFIPLFIYSAPDIKYPTSVSPPIYSGEFKFEWSGDKANYYKYHINLPDGTAKESTTSSSFVKVYTLDLGNHNWAIASCEDEAGTNCSEWSPAASFEIISAPKEFIGGLVPCGQRYNNPGNSGVYESKPCEFSDLFVMVKMLLDFLLWRLGLIALALVVLLAGTSSYFALGSPNIIANLKRLKDSTLKGYALMFSAWLIVNLILKLLGYTVTWWIITF